VSDRQIIGLTEEGKLVFFDKENRKRTNIIDAPSETVLLTKNRLGEVVVVDERNGVKKYVENEKTWEQIANTNTSVFGVLFDSENTCYVITENGIENTKSKKNYFSKESLNHQIQYKGKWG